MHNQDLINRAYQLAQDYVSKNGFKKADLQEVLFLNKIPEDLTNEVVANLQHEDLMARKQKGKKHLLYGVILLGFAISLAVGSYVISGESRIALAGFIFVPGIAYTAAGLWELGDKA